MREHVLWLRVLQLTIYCDLLYLAQNSSFGAICCAKWCVRISIAKPMNILLLYIKLEGPCYVTSTIELSSMTTHGFVLYVTS